MATEIFYTGSEAEKLGYDTDVEENNDKVQNCPRNLSLNRFRGVRSDDNDSNHGGLSGGHRTYRGDRRGANGAESDHSNDRDRVSISSNNNKDRNAVMYLPSTDSDNDFDSPRPRPSYSPEDHRKQSSISHVCIRKKVTKTTPKILDRSNFPSSGSDLSSDGSSCDDDETSFSRNGRITDRKELQITVTATI